MSLTPGAVAHTMGLTVSATKHYLVDTLLVFGAQNWALYPDVISLETEQRTPASLVCFCQYRPGCGKIDLLQGLSAKVKQELIQAEQMCKAKQGNELWLLKT